MDAFVNKWNGRQVTAYGGECVALVAQYLVERGLPIAYANAKDWWMHPAIRNSYEWITNNPTDYNQVPQRGDVVVWNGGLAGSGGYGHIGIYDGRVSPGIFRSFDQNWGGRQAHFVNHNYNNVIGWFRPKVSAPAQGGAEMIADVNQARLAYRLLRGDAPVTDGEINGTAGKRTWAEFATTGQAEVNVREEEKRQIKAQVKNLTDINNQLSHELTTANASSNATKADKDQALQKVAELQTQLTEALDKLKDAQAPADSIIIDKDTVWDKLKSLLSIFSKKG